MFPEGYSAGKLGSQVPNTSVGDFDVVRNSIGTRVNKDGLIEVMDANVPRLDYSDGGCPKLLNESASTNYVLYSEDFASWSGATKSYGGLTPIGSSYFDVNFSGANQTFSSTASGVNGVCSWRTYVKGSKGETMYIGVNGGTNLVLLHTFSGEWDTIEVTNASISNSTKFNFNTYSPSTARSFQVSYAQLEPLPIQTSYIKTLTTPISRGIDIMINGGSQSSFNSNSGVFFVDFKGLYTGSITLNGGSTANRIWISYSVTSIRVVFSVNNSYIADFEIFDWNMELQNKIAFSWKENKFVFNINGVDVASQNSGITFPQGTLINCDLHNGGGAGNFPSKIKSIQVYDYLSDAEMEALTGYDSYSDMTSQFNFNVL